MGANGEAMDGTILKREALRQLIAQWNANRLDLFEISEPNEVHYIFHRFKYVCKCVFSLLCKVMK